MKMSGSSSGQYCECFIERFPKFSTNYKECKCGEENNPVEWGWEASEAGGAVVGAGGRQVTFHPVYSAGTACVRAERPLRPGAHHYWEVEMLSDTYGTDIMVGLGTPAVGVADSARRFVSLLGEDGESYGLSYTGRVQHGGRAVGESRGFGRGSRVGVGVDTWRGELQFYVDRRPVGPALPGLRRHALLYPMLCSTAAQSALRLTYAASRPASLLAAAARALPPAPPLSPLPPGLPFLLRALCWLPFPSESCDSEVQDVCHPDAAPAIARVAVAAPLLNGYYVDSVRREYRLVVRQ